MRIRIRYRKVGKVRFLSHRDLARVLERGVRRAGLPVAYSEGFNPHPKLHFGLAISVGHESLAEYLDVDLDPGRGALPDLAAVPEALDACLPAGVDVTAAVLLEPGTTSLQEAVTSSSWRFRLPQGDPDDVAAVVDRLLGADHIPVDVVRKQKPVREDLRPLLVDLRFEAAPDGPTLVAELGTKPRSVRPAEFLTATGLPEPVVEVGAVRVTRTHQWITNDGVRAEPVPLPTPSPHAGLRAS
jgi:radical SAM-linked protein